MSLSRQIGFWLLALLVLVVLMLVLRDVLLPFIAGLILAYLLDPIAARFQRLGLGRLGATVLIVVLFVVAFVLLLLLIVPLLGNQLAGFTARLPSTISRLQALVAEQGGPLLQRLGGDNVSSEIQKYLGEILSQGSSFVAKFATSLWNGGQALVNVVSLLVVTPVVAFYLLLDWDEMVAKVDGWLPRNHAGTIRGIMRDIDRAIAGFVRGQALVCLILGSIYAGGLTLAGLNFGFLIGMSAGLLSFIPFVGSVVGLVLALLVAVVQFWPQWPMIAAVAGVFVVGQFIEGNILSPKLVGNSVGLHPVWLMFALFAFGALFGFAGLLLAVPLAAAIGVLVRFALSRYLASPLYTGAATPTGGATPPPFV